MQKDTEEAFTLSIRLLPRAAELHYKGTGTHLLRCNKYAYLKAKKSVRRINFCNETHFRAQLHDIGPWAMEWHGLYGRPKVLEISGFGAHLGDRQYFYDTLSSERAYKTAFSRENTYNILTVVYDASSRQSIQNRDFFGAYCKKFNQIRN